MTKFIGPYFAKGGEQPDFTLFNVFMDLFSRIPKNSKVRGAMYMWNFKHTDPVPRIHKSPTPEEVTEQFLNYAVEADTHLILDAFSAKNHKFTVDYIVEKLGDGKVTIDNRFLNNDPYIREKVKKHNNWAKMQRAKGRKVALMPHPNEGYMHEKFFCFSELEGIGKHVVLQCSTHVNETQYYQWNDMIGIYDNVPLYEKYMAHWEDLRFNIPHQKKSRWGDEKKDTENTLANDPLDTESKVSAYFFPRKVHPVKTELRGRIFPEANENTEVLAAASFFTLKDWLNLFNDLSDKGAKVRVVVAEEPANYPTLRELNCEYCVVRNRSAPWGRMHHKYCLIKTPDRAIVWTGSPNLTKSIYRCDESLVRIDDPQVHTEYRAAFNVLWDNAVPMSEQVMDWVTKKEHYGKNWKKKKYTPKGRLKTNAELRRERALFQGVFAYLPHL